MTDKTPAPLSDTREPKSPKWEQFERERLSRRAALKKFGMTSGMAFFGMFAVDDLARMTIKKMEQQKATRQIAETVSKEFEYTGVAFAAPRPCPDLNNQSNQDVVGWNCSCSQVPETGTCEGCANAACGRIYGMDKNGGLTPAGKLCVDHVLENYCTS